ncbi:MAG: hypothetical protein JXA96_13210 [Sedimentisphaerales bacterium]|nr:hypothetical protein [Sedimentisphaerales bacterium]
MNYDLYFIPIIEKALEDKLNKKQALEAAFEEIVLFGRQSNYKIGYQQFCLFMNDINFLKHHFSSQMLERKITENFARPHHLSISIERNETVLEMFIFTFSGGTQTLRKIIPGNYRLILDTGLCLWSDTLTEADLIFSKGAGGDTLKMAADSDRQSPEPVRLESIFSNSIMLALYAGFENGTIEITVDNIRI